MNLCKGGFNERGWRKARQVQSPGSSRKGIRRRQTEQQQFKDSEERSSRKTIHRGKEIVLEEHDDSEEEYAEIQEVKGAKVKSKARNNPFAVPPSKITRMQFELQQPFVEIIDDSVLIHEREDKIRDGQVMDDGALIAAICAMQPTAQHFRRAFKSPSSEMGRHHIALASGFWFITEPHQQTGWSTFDEFAQRARGARKEESESTSDPESHQDLSITLKKVSGNEVGSHESLDVKQEGDEGENRDEKVRYDFNFMVYDKKLKGSNNKVSVLIVDATWSNLSMNKMCQVATYGCKYAIKNMEKGRYAPLYVELWGEDMWRYGIIYPRGIVLLEEGKVVATTANNSCEDLESQLEDAKRRFKQTIGSFTYPDGAYIQGWLYIANEKFCLPNKSFMQDLQCFYQSKMRIIAGDKVLQWTEKDVKNRVDTRLSTVVDNEFAQTWEPMANNKRLKTTLGSGKRQG